MKRRDIEQELKQAVEKSVPDVWDVILSECEKKGSVMVMANEKKRNWKTSAAAAAACIALFCGGMGIGIYSYQAQYRVDSVIELDVNPSIEIDINQKERVLSVKALNADAEEIIDGMDLKGTELDVAVNALLGSMLQHGYINDLANSILVSVENENQKKGNEIQKDLVEKISTALENNSVDAAIMGQTIKKEKKLEDMAKEYGISYGKAALIDKLLEKNTTHAAEDLSDLSIHELNVLLEPYDQTTSELAMVGTANTVAYIGEEKAFEIACAHAGVMKQDVTLYQTELDAKNGVLVYDLDFASDTISYDYEIHAVTGEVLSHETEPVKSPSKKPENMPQESTTAVQTTTVLETQISSETTTTVDVVSPTEPKETPQESTTDVQTTTVLETQISSETTTVPIIPSTESPKPTQTLALTETTQDKITEAKAKEIALQDAGLSSESVTFVKVKLDYENGVLVYELKFYQGNTEYEYEINAQTGAIQKREKEKEIGPITMETQTQAPPTTEAPTSSMTEISAERAKEIAFGHAGVSASDVRELKVERDREDGMDIYEIEFEVENFEYEYEIDARTGGILKHKAEQDD